MTTAAREQSIASTSTLTRFTQRLNDPKVRRRVYLACAILMYLLSLALMSAKAMFSKKEPQFDFACSDGKYYFQYLPSAVIDRDLDFTNQLRDGWGKQPPYDAEMEHDRVKYPIGVSLSLIPSFVLAHGISVPLHAATGKSWFTPNGYTVVYQLLNLGMVMLLVYATLVLLDGLLHRTFGTEGRWTTLALVSVALGTQYLYHTVRFPGMAHVFSAFWMTGTIVASAGVVRVLRERSKLSWHWPAMAFCLAMAIVCRPTNVVFVIFPLWAIVVALEHKRLLQLTSLLPGLLLCGFPILLQLLMWKQMFGVYFPSTYSHGEFVEPFYWSRPQLFNNLFSPKVGLFIWCPVWTIGFIGVLLALKRELQDKWILICCLLSFTAMWYINSAWWCWTSTNYPGRGYIELSGMIVIGLGVLLQSASPSRQRHLVTLTVVAVAMTMALSVAYDLKLVPRLADDVIEQAASDLRRPAAHD